VKAASARTIGASGSSSSVATAMAASALRTLCSPGRFSVTSRSASARRCGAAAVKRICPPGSACTSTARTCAFAQAVADDRARDHRHDRAHAGVVGAQHGRAVEGHAVQEVDEGRLQPREVVAVGLHVVGVDVGDHRQHRQQVQERGVALVGLDHDVVARAQARVGAGAVSRRR
jgi:hypothetical protein